MKMIANLIKVGNVIKYKDKVFQVMEYKHYKTRKRWCFYSIRNERPQKVDPKLMKD